MCHMYCNWNIIFFSDSSTLSKASYNEIYTAQLIETNKEEDKHGVNQYEGVLSGNDQHITKPHPDITR